MRLTITRLIEQPYVLCSFIKTFDDKPANPERDADSVQASLFCQAVRSFWYQCLETCFAQAFLAKSAGTFRDHPVWANAPVEHQSQAMEVQQAAGQLTSDTSAYRSLRSLSTHLMQGLEKYLMTKIFYKTFAQSELDRERDAALTQRMAALNFVQPHHLDIPQQYQTETSAQLAIKELHKINNYKVRHHDCRHQMLIEKLYQLDVISHAGTTRQAGVCPELLQSHQQLAACCGRQ